MIGVLFLVFSLYMIGRNRSFFGSTFTISASFTNTNGLVVGNYVRFSGINVGTVRKIEIVSDTSVIVTMVIDNKVKKFIKRNAKASIGSEGLVGNKLININSQRGNEPPVENGSVLGTLEPIETDAMLRTLNTTNENIRIISSNLKEITAKLNSSKSLWSLLSDTLIAKELKHAVSSVDKASANTAKFTKDASELVALWKEGDGLAKAFFTDTTLSRSLEKSIAEIQVTINNLSATSSELKMTVKKFDEGKGTANLLLYDTATSEQLRKTIQHLEQGTGRFNENMEALKRNFLFRKYFKEQEKKGGR
jgi:phospholipid/cholesterol/gamma-HCH transport system substrate-binding protein